MAEMVIDNAGLVSVDRADNMLIVDGVRIDMGVAPIAMRPDPTRWYRFQRTEDSITVFQVQPVDLRQQELAFHFADRLAADVLETVPSEWLADDVAEQDDPQAKGRYWNNRNRLIEQYEGTEPPDFLRAYEYLTSRQLVEVHPTRPELYVVKEPGPDPEVRP